MAERGGVHQAPHLSLVSGAPPRQVVRQCDLRGALITTVPGCIAAPQCVDPVGSPRLESGRQHLPIREGTRWRRACRSPGHHARGRNHAGGAGHHHCGSVSLGDLRDRRPRRHARWGVQMRPVHLGEGVGALGDGRLSPSAKASARTGDVPPERPPVDLHRALSALVARLHAPKPDVDARTARRILGEGVQTLHDLTCPRLQWPEHLSLHRAGVQIDAHHPLGDHEADPRDAWSACGPECLG